MDKFKGPRPNGPVPPLPGGIVDLSKMPTPKTARVTIFQSCKVEISPAVDEDNIVRGYMLVITDPHENHRYQLDFNQVMMDGLKKILEEIPDTGFPLESPGA